jgi:uncharacterized YccA/Bax inhibitor family protein
MSPWRRIVQSSNPVLTSRLADAARQERAGSVGYGNSQPAGYGYAPPQAPARMMTLDDVVVRTIGLLVLTGISGALSWTLLPDDSPIMALALIGSMIAGLVLGLVISFARVTNPIVIGIYAVVEGVLLGVVSRFFEERWPGIVVQAMIGTFGVFAIMAVLYKMKVLRATPRFTRGVIGALIGVVVLGFVNLIVSMFGGNLGLIDYGTEGKVGWLPIVFSLVCIVVGALTFILDFDAVEQGVRYGMPEKYAWYCAFGLLVGLIFLYWQILRFLSYLRR